MVGRGPTARSRMRERLPESHSVLQELERYDVADADG